jgi:hypothetical protein
MNSLVKGVISATDHAEKTHQDVEQQRRPDRFVKNSISRSLPSTSTRAAPCASLRDNWHASLCFEHHKRVAQDSFICGLGQFFNHPQTERLLAAGHPKDAVVIEHAQVHEINVCAIKNVVWRSFLSPLSSGRVKEVCQPLFFMLLPELLWDGCENNPSLDEILPHP